MILVKSFAENDSLRIGSVIGNDEKSREMSTTKRMRISEVISIVLPVGWLIFVLFHAMSNRITYRNIGADFFRNETEPEL